MSAKRVCQTCGRPLHHFEHRESPTTFREVYQDHFHRFRITYRYGLCAHYHWTRLKVTNQRQLPCSQCIQKHQKAKKRIKKRRIPTLTKDDIDAYIEQRVNERVDARLLYWAGQPLSAHHYDTIPPPPSSPESA